MAAPTDLGSPSHPRRLALPAEVTKITRAFNDAGGNAVLVGGCVRDLLRATPVTDYDIEVFRLAPEAVERVANGLGRVHLVGKQFGVLKLTIADRTYDISVPRRERKVAKGHRGFVIDADPNLSFADAAGRRDFTINAMGYDPEAKTVLDPFNGLLDLERRVLRHVGESFDEDPLRVLRAMQFAARFQCSIEDSTTVLCRSLDLTELPRERMFEEFKKLLLRAERPSIGLELAEPLGVLEHFPELAALKGLEQDPEWHPEGDVWAHNCLVVDEAARLRSGEDRGDLTLMFAALCHDFGKALTTKRVDGRWRSIGHCEAGKAPTRSFLERLTLDKELTDLVATLVAEHLRPAYLYNDRHELTRGAIRRLSLRVPISLLVKVARADHYGRTTADALEREFPAGDWLLARAADLNVEDTKPTPLLKGRHLITLGMSPGPAIGAVLKEAFERQLDGRFETVDEAIAWAEQRVLNPKDP